jgi:aldehyde dehydrogenase (NAD+)
MAKSSKNIQPALKFNIKYAPAPESVSAASINEQYNLFINGKFEKPLSKKYFDTINPATEQIIASVAEAGTADLDKAV